MSERQARLEARLIELLSLRDRRRTAVFAVRIVGVAPTPQEWTRMYRRVAQALKAMEKRGRAVGARHHFRPPYVRWSEPWD